MITQKIKSRSLIIFGIIALSMFMVWTVYGQRQSAARVQWEYKVVNIYQDDAAKILNDLGAEGWELVAVKAGDDATAKGLYHFKRQK